MRPLVLTENKMSGPERQHMTNLAMWKAAGEVLDFAYEPLRLVLADKTSFTPDFFVVFPEHFEVHEVKAGTRDKRTGTIVPFCRGDESLTKLKICARLFHWWKFKLYWYYKEGFTVREIVP